MLHVIINVITLYKISLYQTEIYLVFSYLNEVSLIKVTQDDVMSVKLRCAADLEIV